MSENKSKDSLRPFDPREWLFETPLYKKQTHDFDGAKSFLNLLHSGQVKIDGYCATCERESVFHSHNSPTGAGRAQELRELQTVFMACQRDITHLLVVYALIEYHEPKDYFCIEKIGQFPSHADIANGSLGTFQSVLEKEDRAELTRANGLAAHGVNIGAFVYLRRLFERLVWRAKARKSDAPDDNEFAQLRMEQKISTLSGALPEFMVSNKKVYSVLSKGIHELSENECGSYYELMRRSIFLMLEQEKEIKERAENEKELTRLIARIEPKK